jgi:hypothetical protein
VKYATDTRVREAILRWRGKVVAAADELGIQPKNLRKRLERLGIDLAAVRAGVLLGATSVDPTGPPGSSGPQGTRMAPPAPRSRTSRKNVSGPYSSAGQTPILGGVQQAAAVKDDTGEGTPIPSASGKQRPIRFHPDDQDRLREARLDLIARHRAEFDETAIHHKFFQDEFPGWIARQLNPDAKTNGGKKKGGGA